MTDNYPVDFSMTPYDEDDVEPVSPRRPVFGWTTLPAALWLGAAVIAVAANFLDVVRYRTESQDSNGQAATFTFGFDGWGKPHLVSTSPEDFGDSLNSGARWGWLFTVCAVLLVAAAIWSVLPHLRFQLFGPAELAAAGAFGLFGGIAALVLSFEPTRHQLALTADQTNTKFYWGWCWQLELVAAVIGFLGWVWFRRQNEVTGVDAELTPAEEGADDFRSWSEPESDAIYPQTENRLDDATGRPHIPRDQGPSPW